MPISRNLHLVVAPGFKTRFFNCTPKAELNTCKSRISRLDLPTFFTIIVCERFSSSANSPMTSSLAERWMAGGFRRSCWLMQRNRATAQPKPEFHFPHPPCLRGTVTGIPKQWSIPAWEVFRSSHLNLSGAVYAPACREWPPHSNKEVDASTQVYRPGPGSIGYQQFDGRFISPVRIVKLYFLFIQADCTDLIRMGKGIVLGVGGHFSAKRQINRLVWRIAINTDAFPKRPRALASNVELTSPFSPAGWEIWSSR